jgi:hypothetical protein
MAEKHKPSESVTEVVNHIFELPFDAQLGVLRTIAPQIIGCLQGEQREGFMRDLEEEIENVARGGPPYDVRPDKPSHMRPPEEQPGA